jgi:hypothetical protein
MDEHGREKRGVAASRPGAGHQLGEGVIAPWCRSSAWTGKGYVMGVAVAMGNQRGGWRHEVGLPAFKKREAGERSLAAGGESQRGKLLHAHHGSRAKSSQMVGAGRRDVHREEESCMGENG